MGVSCDGLRWNQQNRFEGTFIRQRADHARIYTRLRRAVHFFFDSRIVGKHRGVATGNAFRRKPLYARLLFVRIRGPARCAFPLRVVRLAIFVGLGLRDWRGNKQARGHVVPLVALLALLIDKLQFVQPMGSACLFCLAATIAKTAIHTAGQRKKAKITLNPCRKFRTRTLTIPRLRAEPNA